MGWRVVSSVYLNLILGNLGKWNANSRSYNISHLSLLCHLPFSICLNAFELPSKTGGVYHSEQLRQFDSFVLIRIDVIKSEKKFLFSSFVFYWCGLWPILSRAVTCIAREMP